MMMIDTELADELWAAATRIPKISEHDVAFRQRLAFAFGHYKADMASKSDVLPRDVRKALLDAAEGAEFFLKKLGPIAAVPQEAAQSQAACELAISTGIEFEELNGLLGTAILVRDHCRKLADCYQVRGGPRRQYSRDLFIQRLDSLFTTSGIAVTEQAFAKLLRILMRSVQTRGIASEDSLLRAIRMVRSINRTNRKRKKPPQIRRG